MATKRTIPRLPSGWESMAFGDFAEVNPARRLTRNGSAKFVEMAKVLPHNPRIAGFEMRAAEGSGPRFRNGDTLFARITPCTENGKVAFVDCLDDGEVAFGSTEFIVLAPREGVSTDRYLYYLAASERVRAAAVRRMLGTSGRQRVPDWVFTDELEVYAPPPPEQAKIAAVLGALDEVVERSRGVIAQTKALRQALLYTLLTRGLPGERTKFKTVRLGDIYAERSEHGIAGLPVMSVTNNGMVVRSTTDRRVESDLPDEGHALVRKDDIAYNMMRMWQGVSCLADRDCLVSPAYVVCSPKKGMVPQYGAYLLKAPHIVQLLRLHSQGVHEDRLRLYYKHFAPIKVEIPDEGTQRASAEMIAGIDARLAAAHAHLANLDRLKSALSAALLTGKIRVNSSGAHS